MGQTVDVLLNQTPFYGESGGQIGDAGKLTSLKGFVGEVEDTSKPLGKLHVLRTKVVAGELSVGETLHQAVDAERRNRVRANHSSAPTSRKRAAWSRPITSVSIFRTPRR